MNFRVLYLFAIAALLLSCSSSQVKRYSSKPKKVPSWITTRPVVDGYYTGIGAARFKAESTSHVDFAKSNALNDLVSEIEVTISGNAMVQQIEKDQIFKEEFQSMTKASIRDNIEGYELVDSWSDDEYYWVYYRLSKAKYREIKNRQMEMARERATDYYRRGMEEKANLKIANALNFYLKGMNELRMHLDERILVDGELEDKYLVNELMSEIIDIFSRTKIGLNRTTFEYKMGKPLNEQIVFKAIYDGRMGLPDMPFKSYFSNGQGSITSNVRTDPTGSGKMILGRVTGSREFQELIIELDMSAFVHENGGGQAFLERLISLNASIPSVIINIHVLPIVATFDFKETEFASSSERYAISNSIKKMLSTKNFSFTDSVKYADVRIELKSSATKGKYIEAHDVYTVYIDSYISIFSTKTGNKEFFKGFDQVRGQQTGSWINALKVAQKDLLKMYESEVIPKVTSVGY